MFCPKCGSQVADGEKFCNKCGAALAEDVGSDQSAGAKEAVSQQPAVAEKTKKSKKSSKKFIWIIAGVFLVIILIAILGSRGGDDKYVRFVKKGTFDAYPQKTVGEAFDAYLKNPKWESGISEDGERFVNVSGKILYYDKETNIVVQFLVDEETGRFNYHACELNGVPQNNLFFWGLMEAVFSEDSASEAVGSNSQTGSAESGSKNMIGETWTVIRDDQNVEVTLDSIEFRKGKFSMLTLDDGCIWMVVTLTANNIGTKRCSFGLNGKIVYADQYEYESVGSYEGDWLEIEPLTEPKTQSIAFMVPEVVKESGDSLVLSIMDWTGKVDFSYTIRQGTGMTSGITPGADENYDISSIIYMYAGSWQDSYSERASMDISWDDEDSQFYITIFWASGATDYSSWYLYGDYVDNGIQYCGVREDCEYSYEADDTFYYDYEDQTGFLWIDSSGILRWNDYSAGMGADCAFVRIQ